MLHNIYNKLKNNSDLFKNILGAIGVRGLALFVNLVTIPAYMNYFTNQQILGVWFSILAILSWILMFDLGIGNGLRNNLVITFVNKDNLKAKKYISSAYINIGVMSIFILIIGIVLIGFVDWNPILNISSNVISNSILIKSIRLVFIGIIFNFFLKIITSILYAMQKSALSNLISLISNSLILLYTLIATKVEPSIALLNISLVYILTINIPLIISTIIIFVGPLKDIKPNIKFYSKDLSKVIMNLGYTFFWIQITLLVINSSNELLITRLFSPEDVVDYQIYYKLLSLPLVFFSILTIPIWSAVTKAFNESRKLWIVKVSKYLNLTALFIILLYTLSIPLLPRIFQIWLGGNSIDIEYIKVVLFILFNSVMIFVYSSTAIANGIGNLKLQVILNSGAAIFKIPLSIILSYFIDSWVIIIVVNTIIMLPLAILQPISNKKRL